MNPLASLILSAVVAGASATANRYVVNPTERMVVVPGLERLGPSRISTVQHCAALAGNTNWQRLMTDWELETMDVCLREHT